MGELTFLIYIKLEPIIGDPKFAYPLYAGAEPCAGISKMYRLRQV